MTVNSISIAGRLPLADYPWEFELDRLLNWARDEDSKTISFCFDLMMSAAYIDASSGIEKNLEYCKHAPAAFNHHLGFTNLCSTCYNSDERWQFQKAIKPQSGAIGKLSSELILRFIKILNPNISEVLATGGSGVADAIIKTSTGLTVFAEVKSAPLLTYPFLFALPKSQTFKNHTHAVITNSQLRECSTAIFMHENLYIELGKFGTPLWPFKPIIDFVVNPLNKQYVKECVAIWSNAQQSYKMKDRGKKCFFLTNACGAPPKIAKIRDGWPSNKTISDSKTSAGMDRTDDIKKGVYQTLKIGSGLKLDPNVLTAIISNLPAYRHRDDYLEPFTNMYWGLETDLRKSNGMEYIHKDDLRRVFDLIITLDESIMRDVQL